MTAQFPPGQFRFPPVPGEPDVVVLRRVLSEAETKEKDRAAMHVARRQHYWPVMWGTIGTGLVLAFLVGLFGGRHSDGSPTMAAISTSLLAFLIIVLFAVVFPLAARNKARLAREELSPDGALQVAWNPRGFAVCGGARWRAVQVPGDVTVAQIFPRSAACGPGPDFLAMRYTEARQGNLPPTVALPLDLVPAPAVHALYAAGVMRPDAPRR